MERHQFGRTGFRVSPIALGTVALGTDYGIESLAGAQTPAVESAVAIIRYAVSQGINLFDTAPNYGEAEERVGLALGKSPDTIIATKFTVPAHPSDEQFVREVQQSVDTSRTLLQRDCLDILQIHNATTVSLSNPRLLEILSDLKSNGQVKRLGVSVYGSEPALMAIETGLFDMVQVAFNMLDQPMIHTLFPIAKQANVAILVRSAFLKGALTEKVLQLPPHLDKLKQAVLGLKEEMGIGWNDLPILALRFCLSFDAIGSVLIGARTTGEIDDAVRAVQLGALTDGELTRIARFGLDDPHLTNPSYWGID